MVEQCTTGLTGPLAGLGANLAALANLAFLLLSFLAGWLNQVLTNLISTKW